MSKLNSDKLKAEIKRNRESLNRILFGGNAVRSGKSSNYSFDSRDSGRKQKPAPLEALMAHKKVVRLTALITEDEKRLNALGQGSKVAAAA